MFPLHATRETPIAPHHDRPEQRPKAGVCMGGGALGARHFGDGEAGSKPEKRGAAIKQWGSHTCIEYNKRLPEHITIEPKAPSSSGAAASAASKDGAVSLISFNYFESMHLLLFISHAFSISTAR